MQRLHYWLPIAAPLAVMALFVYATGVTSYSEIKLIKTIAMLIGIGCVAYLLERGFAPLPLLVLAGLSALMHQPFISLGMTKSDWHTFNWFSAAVFAALAYCAWHTMRSRTGLTNTNAFK